MVVGLDVHAEHARRHRVDRKRTIDGGNETCTQARGGHHAHLPCHRTEGVGRHGREDQHAALRCVFDGHEVRSEPHLNFGVASEEGFGVRRCLLPPQVHGDVDGCSSDEVVHFRRNAALTVAEVDAVEHEVVVQTGVAVRPAVGRRHGIHAISVHHTKVKIDCGSIVPQRRESEHDLDLSRTAEATNPCTGLHGDGVLRMKFHEACVARQGHRLAASKRKEPRVLLVH